MRCPFAFSAGGGQADLVVCTSPLSGLIPTLIAHLEVPVLRALEVHFRERHARSVFKDCWHLL